MKHLTTIAAMLIVFAARGQGTATPKVSTGFKRLLFGVNISPDYCYRTLIYFGNNEGGSDEIDLRNKSQTFKIGYTAGFNFCYNMNRHWGIESGLQYSNKGYANEIVIHNPEHAVIDPKYPVGTTIKENYNKKYLDVPVRAVFSFGERKVRFVASFGITTNIFLRATETVIIRPPNGRAKRDTRLQEYTNHMFNFSPTISAGVDYRLGKKMNLRAEPTFRFGLIKIYPGHDPVRTHLWSTGLNITCYYALK